MRTIVAPLGKSSQYEQASPTIVVPMPIPIDRTVMARNDRLMSPASIASSSAVSADQQASPADRSAASHVASTATVSGSQLPPPSAQNSRTSST